jgi:hypothetical protein
MADDRSAVSDPKPILNYRQPGRDPKSSLDRMDRILVKLALAIVFAVVILIIFSFS